MLSALETSVPQRLGSPSVIVALSCHHLRVEERFADDASSTGRIADDYPEGPVDLYPAPIDLDGCEHGDGEVLGGVELVLESLRDDSHPSPEPPKA